MLIATELYTFILLAGLIVAEGRRFPHRRRHKREPQQQKLTDRCASSREVALDLLAFSRREILSVIYVFSPWRNFADDHSLAGLGLIGAGLRRLMLWLLWKAPAEMNRIREPNVARTNCWLQRPCCARAPSLAAGQVL